MSTKFCEDCAHYVDTGLGVIYNQCKLTLLPSTVKRGEWTRNPEYPTIFCKDLRIQPELCGPEAVWFQPKTTTETV